MELTFVYASSYLASAKGILTDNEQRVVEEVLLANPRAGDTVNGTGGVRKLRVALPGRGKRSGARVLYYFLTSQARVYLLLAYAKNESADISANGKRMLKQLVSLIDLEG